MKIYEFQKFIIVIIKAYSRNNINKLSSSFILISFDMHKVKHVLTPTGGTLFRIEMYVYEDFVFFQFWNKWWFFESSFVLLFFNAGLLPYNLSSNYQSPFQDNNIFVKFLSYSSSKKNFSSWKEFFTHFQNKLFEAL